jgi:uncharacterized repeat protein (TIGR04076 family)
MAEPIAPAAEPAAPDLRLPAIASFADYRRVWASLAPLEVVCVEKREQCPHAVGDAFRYANPYRRPEGLCPALAHVLELYLWRAELGFPSWNEADFLTYRVHCPDALGTVWELRKAPPGGAAP